MEAASHPWPTLGVLLLRDGIVTKEDLESVLDAQRDSRSQRVSGARLGELLVERGLVTREQVAKLVAEQYELPYIELSEDDVDVSVARLLGEDLARSFSALPLSALPGGSILVAIADPATVLFAEDLRQALGEAPLRFAVVPQDALEWQIDRVFALVPEWWQEENGTEQSDDPAFAEDGLDPEHASSNGSYLGSSRAAAQLWPPLGALLIREGLITDEELDAALAQQKLSRGKRLGEILVERGTVTRSEVARLLAEQYELPFVDLDSSEVDEDAAGLISAEIARRHSGLPIGFEPDGALRVAIADPAAILYSDELRHAVDTSVRFVVAPPNAIEDALERMYGSGPGLELVGEDVADAAADHTAEPEPDEDVVQWLEEIPTDDGAASADAPVAAADVPAPEPEPAGAPARLHDVVAPEVEEALERALVLGATDIHFTPQPHAVVVRVRIDGMLRELATFPTSRQEAIVGRLKHLGGLDLETSQAPQEGHLQLENGDGANLRLVVLPTAHGEKATLHLLTELSQPTSLSELGLTDEGDGALRGVLAQSSGLVVVCGPPESGGSTTLYAMLRELNTPERALATIEDPVEQVLSGVDQVAVDHDSGLGFAPSLRAILLSDPDVVLVGELADPETAVGAVRAAVAGRLVLTYLGVSTPAAALERLLELGAERGPLAATLACVVAQRLVHRICADCREPYYPSADELAELGRSPEEAGRRLLARGSGCVACGGTGFRGRVAVFEILSVTDEIRSSLASGTSAEEIERMAVSAGMRTFRDQCVRLCLEGVTTVSELRRVTAEQPEAAFTATPDPAPYADEDAEIELA